MQGSELATLFPCKHCGAQIAPPSDLATSSVVCSHCRTEQLVPDTSKRLEVAERLAHRRADNKASRRFDTWLYVVIGVFVAGLLGYIGWVVYRQTRAAIDPEVAQSELRGWVGKQHGCRTLVEPSTKKGHAEIQLAATGCVRVIAQTDASVMSLTATLKSAAVGEPRSGHTVELRHCVAAPETLTLVVDDDAGTYAIAAVDCPRE